MKEMIVQPQPDLAAAAELLRSEKQARAEECAKVVAAALRQFNCSAEVVVVLPGGGVVALGEVMRVPVQLRFVAGEVGVAGE